MPYVYILYYMYILSYNILYCVLICVYNFSLKLLYCINYRCLQGALLWHHPVGILGRNSMVLHYLDVPSKIPIFPGSE